MWSHHAAPSKAPATPLFCPVPADLHRSVRRDAIFHRHIRTQDDNDHQRRHGVKSLYGVKSLINMQPQMGAPKAIALALTGLVLAGCNGQENTRLTDAPESLLGETLKGELTTQSPINLTSGSRYGAHWVCGSQGVGRYTLDAAFGSTLSVLSEEGQLIDRTHADADSIGQQVVLGSQGKACQLLVITGDEGAFGPYTLKGEKLSPTDSTTLPLNGQLMAPLADKSQTYQLKVERPMELDIAIADGSGRASVMLEGNGTELHAQPCGSHSQQLSGYVMPGDYTLSIEPKQKPQHVPEGNPSKCSGNLVGEGPFIALTSHATRLPDGMRNGGPIQDGDHITGTLAAGQPNTYLIQIEQPTRIEVAATSSEFDTLLQLSGQGVQQQDDDGAGGTNSKLSSFLVKPGRYELTIGAYDDNTAAGRYTLDAQFSAIDTDFRNEGDVDLGSNVMGMRETFGTNQYTLHLEQTSEVNINLTSDNFDTILKLSGNGQDQVNDDVDGGTNSRIQTLLPAGDYTLNIDSYEGTGPYQLSVEGHPFDGQLRPNGAEARSGDSFYGEVQPSQALTYTVVITQAGQYQIDAVSTAFDTMLTLQGANTDLEDDDGGNDTNARINATLQPGRYQLKVTGYEAGAGMVKITIDG